MPSPFSYPQSTGAFIPTTNVWDVNQIYAANLDPKLTELLVRMYQNLNLMATNVNIKDVGFYPTLPFINGQLFFPNPANSSQSSAYPAFRQVNRVVINFGALPNAATKSVPHGIPVNAAFTFTRIYGCATDPNTLFIPLPYVSSINVAHNIELNVDPVNVNITTGFNYSAFTITYIILEWLQF